MSIVSNKISGAKLLHYLKAVASLMLIAAHTGWAAEYSVESELNMSAEHNDNIRLTPTNPISLQGRSVSPKALAKIATETWDASLDIDLSFNDFNRSEYNSDDQFITLATNKKTELHTFAINAEAVHDSTRTSEQETSGIITTSAQRREMYSLAPQWTYMVTDRNYLSVSASLSETEYSSDTYTNYDYSSVQINWTRVFDEQLRMTLVLTGSEYEPEERLATFGTTYKAESTSYGAQIGGEYGFTENWSINALVGSTKTDQKYIITDPQGACTNPQLAFFGLTPGLCTIEDFESDNLVTDISTQWSNERNELSLAYSVQNQPSSQGYEVEYERYTMSWKNRLTEKSDIRLALTYGVNEAVDTSVSSIDPLNFDRDFSDATVSYYYRATQKWWLNATYNYTWQDTGVAINDAEANRILIGISYRPTQSVWSR
jgi:hypothetical protein